LSSQSKQRSLPKAFGSDFLLGYFKFSFIAPLRAAPLAPYDEGAAERSEAGGEKNVLSSLPQSKIGPKVPIFASSLTEGAKAAFGGKRNDKSQLILMEVYV
jgi:hypothetical protein